MEAASEEATSLTAASEEAASEAASEEAASLEAASEEAASETAVLAEAASEVEEAEARRSRTTAGGHASSQSQSNNSDANILEFHINNLLSLLVNV